MTNQVIDILLEKPDKVERIVLLLLKTLISVWGLNLVLLYFQPTFAIGFSDSQSILSFDFFKDFSAIRMATYLVLFIVFWVLIWEVFANWLLPFLCKLFVWITQIVLLVVPMIIIGLIVMGYRYLFKRPVKEEVISDNEKLTWTQNFFAKLNDENRTRFFFGSLFTFHFINTISKSSAGSEFLYLIMEHEKTDFVKSRILAYYTVALVIFITVGIKNPEFIGWIYYSIIFVLGFIAIVIAAMRDILNDLNNNNLTDLKNILPIDIYQNMVDETVENHEIAKSFKLFRLRKRLVLSRVYDKSDEVCDFPRKKIHILRFTSEEETMTLIPFFSKNMEDIPDELKVVIVADMIPDILMRNFMERKGIYFIYTDDEEQLHLGLNKIHALLEKWINVNQENLVQEL
jgi:hypothetical protein